LLTFANGTQALSVNFLAPPRTHTGGQLQPFTSSLRSGRRFIAEWFSEKRERRLFYPFSTSDSPGYRSHMKSTNARTFGVGRRLDVWRIHKATSEPEIVPH